MKNSSTRLIKTILLSILFFVTIVSIIGGEQGTNPAWTTIHIWAGSLMLVGASIHLATNLDWARAVFSRPSQALSLQTRRNRRTGLGLFITGGICTLTGARWLALPIVRLNHLHTMSGLFMIVLMFIHLALHFRWLANTIRQLFGARPQENSTFITQELLAKGIKE